MTDYVAFEAPAWLWIASVLALLCIGVAFGLGAAAILRLVATRSKPLVDDEGPVTERDFTIKARAQADHVAITAKIPVVWPRDDEITQTQVSPT